MFDGWEQQFDFYLGYRDDVPVVTFLDMAAMNHLPVKTHETALLVSVAMRHPREDGLRSSQDFEEMTRFEDRLIDSLEKSLSAIYWGREVTGGRTDFFFSASAPADRALRTKATVLARAQADGLEVNVQVAEDPEWNCYRDSYPSPYHQQTMLNRRLQEQMERLGDRLEKRRTVDHLALFPTRTAAEIAAKNLKAAKFSTDRVQGPDASGRFTLEFHRKDACNGLEPDAFVAEVLTAISPAEGMYDGWGSKLRR